MRLTIACALAGGMLMPPALVRAAAPGELAARVAVRPAGTIRVVTYNASLNREADGQLLRDLATADNAQARVIAAVIQRVRPDLLLVNEFDYDTKGESARLFQQNYLAVPQHGAAAITFPFRYTAPSNTGVPLPSAFDLDHDGATDGPADAQGFGKFPGQYGLVVYSRFAIDGAAVRTFQNFLWRDMPRNAMPADFYPPAAVPLLRLSSKSHWDLPVQVTPRRVLHFLVSHPTPSAFDGPEDRNGRRNHDEIRLLADYITPGKGDYLVDDKGARGGLARDASFVIAGDLNADPNDGNSFEHAVRQLLDSPRVQARPVPASEGGRAASERQGGANLAQLSDPLEDTADFGDRDPGNLRADYVLPSKDLAICASGVFWPTPEDAWFALVNDDTRLSSDHRLVWTDLSLEGRCPK